MAPKITSIDYSSLPTGLDRCGSDSPNNLAYAVRQALEKLDPNQDGRLNLGELPDSPTLEWGLELGFLTGRHPAEKRFARLAKTAEAFTERFNLCKCSMDYWSTSSEIDNFDGLWLDFRKQVEEAKDRHQAPPPVPVELKPMLCKEDDRRILSNLTGQSYDSLEGLKKGLEFAVFRLR